MNKNSTTTKQNIINALYKTGEQLLKITPYLLAIGTAAYVISTVGATSNSALSSDGCTIGTVVNRDCLNPKNQHTIPCQEAINIVVEYANAIGLDFYTDRNKIRSAIQTIGNMCI